jgi:hypothetical protein
MKDNPSIEEPRTMLAFEAEQWQAFADAAFIRRMAAVLASFTGPAHPAAPDDIAEQLQRARRHGFVEERDCAVWVLCAWCLGEDFHRKIAAVEELLGREDVGPVCKSLGLELMLHGIFVSLAGESRMLP